MHWITWGEHGSPRVTIVFGYGIGEALRDGIGRGLYERSRFPCVLRSSFAADLSHLRPLHRCRWGSLVWRAPRVSGTAGFHAGRRSRRVEPRFRATTTRSITTPGYGQTAVLGVGLYPGSEVVVVQLPAGRLSARRSSTRDGGNVVAYP